MCPDGEGLTDAQGRFVPMRLIKDVDIARHDLVCELVGWAKRYSGELRKFREATLADLQAFLDLSAEKYGTSYGGAKGNVTLTSYDGRFKVQRQIAEHLTFDERLQIAKQLIDQCIDEWAEGAQSELKVLVNDAFQVNKEGQISRTRVLGLRRLDISHPKWLEAMRAISDSIQVSGSKSYIRFYERVGDSDQYAPVPLDLAAV